MSNFEFLIIIYGFNSSLLFTIILRSIKKKSPRILLVYLFLPILLSIPLSLLLQDVLEISDISYRQLIANILVSAWCLKSFVSYKSLKVTLMANFLDDIRESISDKNYSKIIYSVFKLSLFQSLCFSSLFSLNYLSGYSSLNFLDLLGLTICIIGSCFEFISEREIKLFSNNRSKIIKTGLWSYTRHPNLVGIYLFFLGIQILALSAVGSHWSLVGLFLVTYLIFKTLIPSTEKKLILKYQDYADYKETVPRLFNLKFK